jgi:quinol monooxygenase YgiN
MRFSQHLIPAVTAILIAAFALAAPSARAQNATDPTLYVMRYIEVMPGSKDDGAALLKKLATESRKDDGALRFDVLERTAPQNQFVTLETWKDQKALDAHMGAAHTKQFLAAIAPMLIAPIDERPCIAIDVAPTQAVGSNAVYAITHVDVIPPSRESAVGMLKSAASASRMEHGNLAFDVLQQTARTNHFQVVDIWNNKKAEDAHQIAAETKDLRGKLLPLGGALYDRRWYRALSS